MGIHLKVLSKHNRLAFFVAISIIVLVLSACDKAAIKGSGNVISEARPVSAFDKIKLKGQGNITVTKGQLQSIEIVTDDNLMPLIETTVNGKKLTLSSDKQNIRPTKLDFIIVVTDLKGVSISGSGDLEGKSTFASEDFYAEISGSGDIHLNLETENLETNISGSGAINLSGKTDRYKAAISGSGDINAFDMAAKKVSLSINGSGDCRVHAIENLKARISGSGDVYYKGRPEINSSISGSGTVKSHS